MKAQKILAMMFYLTIPVVICGCYEETTVDSVGAVESKKEALAHGHRVIFKKKFGNGYFLTVLSPGVADLNKKAKCIPKRRRINAWHINVIFNRKGIPKIEKPLINIHVTFWKRNRKPRYCFGVYATKGKQNKYGRGNVIFCTTNCRNGKLERFNDTYEEIKTAFFTLQLWAVAGYGLSALGCAHVLYYAAMEMFRAFVPKLFNLSGFFSGPPPPIPPEFIEQLSPQLPPNDCARDVNPDSPLPHEFNPALTVVTRRWGLHVIGNQAEQYRFTQWYADPNPANLPAIWTEGRWNGFSMGFDEPYGYNRFSPAKQRGSDFLPAGGPFVRVSDGVQVTPDGGLALTCGNRTSNINLLTEADMIQYPIECVNDVPEGTPLPHGFRPELTVAARDFTGLHVIGNEAEEYDWCQFYADPNPANLLTIWVQGRWNGYSMGYEIPYGYNRFSPAKQRDADFLSAGGPFVRVADGVQVTADGGLALTCGNRTSNINLLIEADMIQYPIECALDVDPEAPLPNGFRSELTVVTRRWGLHVIGNQAELYGYAICYADPNPANLLSIWIEGQWNGQSMIFEVPYGYNRFSPAKQIGSDFLLAGGPFVRVSDGVQVPADMGLGFTCGNRTSDFNLLTDRDMMHQDEPEEEEPGEEEPQEDIPLPEEPEEDILPPEEEPEDDPVVPEFICNFWIEANMLCGKVNSLASFTFGRMPGYTDETTCDLLPPVEQDGLVDEIRGDGAVCAVLSITLRRSQN